MNNILHINMHKVDEDVIKNWSKYAKIYDPIKCASIDGTDTEPHDKAVIRALNSTYHPNRFVKGKPECTIFVSRLNYDTTKETIISLFSKYGKIKRFRLVRDLVTGLPKGYGFVEYEHEHDAEEAYRLANKMVIDGKQIFVDFECERLLQGWKPRRLGGGFGGKKESGQLRFGGRDRPFKKPIALELKEEEEERKMRRRKDEKRHRDKPHSPPMRPEKRKRSRSPVRPKSPPARPRSPPSRLRTPPARPKSPLARPRSPPTRPRSPPARPRSPPARPRSPPARPRSPPPRPRSPLPRRRSPSPKRRPPSPRRRRSPSPHRSSPPFQPPISLRLYESPRRYNSPPRLYSPPPRQYSPLQRHHSPPPRRNNYDEEDFYDGMGAGRGREGRFKLSRLNGRSRGRSRRGNFRGGY